MSLYSYFLWLHPSKVCGVFVSLSQIVYMHRQGKVGISTPRGWNWFREKIEGVVSLAWLGLSWALASFLLPVKAPYSSITNTNSKYFSGPLYFSPLLRNSNDLDPSPLLVRYFFWFLETDVGGFPLVFCFCFCFFRPNKIASVFCLLLN